MNKKQKIALMILIPIVIFVGALGIASTIVTNRPFRLSETWSVWFVASALIVLVENYLLKD